MDILYKSSHLYHALMTLVYNKYRKERFQAVARYVPEDANVLDVCCGDGSLSTYLPPGATYRGLDYSQDFVKKAHQENRDVTRFNLREDPLPSAQIVICQVSLFQFYPDHEAILSKLFQAAEQRLIISESVFSLTQSKWKWIAAIVAWGTHANGMSNDSFRFSPQSLAELFKPYEANLHAADEVCGGRDWVYVLDK